MCYSLFEAFGRAAEPIGRSERIRTSGPCVPNTVLYQAELHSECEGGFIGREGGRQGCEPPAAWVSAPAGRYISWKVQVTPFLTSCAGFPATAHPVAAARVASLISKRLFVPLSATWSGIRSSVLGRDPDRGVTLLVAWQSCDRTMPIAGFTPDRRGSALLVWFCRRPAGRVGAPLYPVLP